MVNNITGNKVYGLMIGFLVLILSISFVSALNAAVGNGKFVISNATVGDVIERTMKIYNNNSFEVRIELLPAGNLSKYIKVLDNNITMTPNSEKEFRFSVKVPNEGRNDGEIDVKFIPVNMTANGKNGIVIPTTMIIFAQKGTGGTIDWTSWFGGKNNTANTNKTGSNPGTSGSGSGMSMFEVLMIITAIIFIVLLILLYLFSKRKNSGAKGEKLNTKKKEK